MEKTWICVQGSVRLFPCAVGYSGVKESHTKYLHLNWLFKYSLGQKDRAQLCRLAVRSRDLVGEKPALMNTWLFHVTYSLEKRLKHMSALSGKRLNHQFRESCLCSLEASEYLIVPPRAEWLLRENDFVSKMTLAWSFEIFCRLSLLQYLCTMLGSIPGSQIHWQMQSLSPSLGLFCSFNF